MFARTVLALLVVVGCHGQSADSRAQAQQAAWDVLDAAWASAQTEQGENVLGSLARVRSDRATDVFRQALRGSPGVAAMAANLLSEHRVSELLPEIKARLKAEREPHVQIALVACLKKLRTPEAADLAMPFAMEDHEPVTGVAFGVLSDLGSVAIPALGVVLDQGCPKCRESAAYVLMRMGAEGVPALRRVLGDKNPRVGAVAAVALSRTGDISGAEALRAAVNDADYGLRVWSALALYNLGELQYQQALLKEVGGSQPGQRFFAVREIVRDGNRPLRDLVLGVALNDPSAAVRSAVLDGLHEEEGDGPVVHALLRDADAGLRLAAAKRLLARGADRAAVDSVLRDSFHAGSPSDQEGLLTGLAGKGALSQPEKDLVFLAMSSSSPTVQAAAASATINVGQEAIPSLIPMLASADVFVSASAADALVTISPSQALPILFGQLQFPRRGMRIICAGYLLHALEAEQ